MRLGPLTGAISTCLAIGCSAVVSGTPETADAEVGQTSAALIEIERTGESTYAVARFARAREGQLGERELRLLKVNIDLPALGSCSASGRDAQMAAPAARGIELVDMGQVTTRVGDRVVVLDQRRFPDVLDSFFGVVYSGEAPFVPEGGYDIQVAGQSIQGHAPQELNDVRIAGQASPGAQLASGDALDLTWARGDARDVVYVDVSSAAFAGTCAYADTGRATLPVRLPAGETRVVVHRLHRETVVVTGVGPAEVRFDFSKALTINAR